MNGYEMMADSYRQLVKQGKIDKETADREIRVYDFLATCDSDDLCRMVDSSAFNDIIRAYLKMAVQSADIDEDAREKVVGQLRWLFDEKTAKAKSELSVVETAVKEKKAEGAEKFGWDGMAERIERARKEAGKDNHIKALEARISLLERFISLPQVKPLWEQFQALIGRKKPQKDHER